MRHYGIGQWTDYVRGFAGADEAELSRHLAQGCTSCQGVVESLREVTEAMEARGQSRDCAERQVMDLVWDSARAPWLAGDESQDAGRQLHFANSEFELNARVEGGVGGAASTLSGRLQSRFKVGVSDLEVRMVSEQEVVDKGSTGKLGEFELPMREHDTAELQIALNEELELIVTLAEL